MAAWSFERFQRELKQGITQKVVCLYGPETYLVDESLQQLVDGMVDPGARDFNLDVFYAGDTETEKIKNALEMLPMMATQRVVVLKSIENLKAKDLEDLLSVVENPIESSLFILVGESVDQRKKFFKSIEKSGALVKMERLPEQELPKWISHLAKKEGKTVSGEAASLLCQLVGSSLLDMRNEIQKLSQFIGTRPQIEAEDVKKVVTHSRIESIFGLTNAIGARDRANSLTFLAQLLDHGESEVGILALSARHIRILLAVREGLEVGLQRAQLATSVGVPQFFIQNYIDQSRKWPLEKLEEMLGVILETDRALKSSNISGHIWLENFIIKACQTST